MRLDRRTVIAAVAASPLLAARIHAKETNVPQNNVVELRQYTLYGGRRDTLIELFERELVAPQDALGARVLGTFRDLDDPDRFVWLRGFDSMAARAEALEAFYTGPVWRTHRAAANATMVDSDNVLVLRPVGGASFPQEVRAAPVGVIAATLHYLGRTAPDDFVAFFDGTMRPRLAELGADILATFVTEASPNNFPRLPVREGEPVFVWLTRWGDLAEESAFWARFSMMSGWRDAAGERLLPALARKPERLRLAPTAGSRLR